MARSCLLVVAAAFVTLTGCGDTPDSLSRENLAFMREAVSILESIKDDASAKAAVPRLKALNGRGKALDQRFKALKMTDAQIKAGIKPHEKEMHELVGEMGKALFKRHALIKKNPELAAAIESLGKY